MLHQNNKLKDLVTHEQHRSLAVILRLLEKSLRETEEWLSGREVNGILYRKRLALSEQNRLAARQAVTAALTAIADLAEQLELEQEEENMVASLGASMIVQWVNLCEEYAGKLRRFGPVHPDLAPLLDPRIDQLAAMTARIGDIVRGKDYGDIRPTASADNAHDV